MDEETMRSVAPGSVEDCDFPLGKRVGVEEAF